MITSLFSAAFAPFTGAVVVLLGLLALELVALALGASLVSDTDGPDIDFDVPELEPPELDALEAGALEPAALELPDAPDAPPSPIGWTGFGRVPFLIWFAAALTGFGVSGIVVQTIGPVPLWLAVPVASVAGWAFARGFSGLFARAVPRTESSVQSTRQLARRRGVVTQGTARRGRPAEIRVTDRHGNSHYVRVEPFRDDDAIERGQSVLTIWDRRAGELRVVSLD